MKQTRSGFTLIELLVVSTIIIVLATIGFASYTSAVKSARDSKRRADMETVRQALVLYKQEQTSGAYPAGTEWQSVMDILTSPGNKFISEPTPTDPMGTGLFTYSVNSPTTGFCVCANVENTSKGNVASQTCSGFATTGEYYCLANP